MAALAALLAANPAAAATQSPEAGPGPIFVDVAATSGLDFVHFNGMSGEHLLPRDDRSGRRPVRLRRRRRSRRLPGAGSDDRPGQDAGRRAGAAGRPAAALRPALPQRPGGRRRRRLEPASSTSPPPAVSPPPPATAWEWPTGDYDDDGWTDLYVTNVGPNQLWRNQGDGTFRDVTAEAGVGDPLWGASAAFADLDGDGWLDLYVDQLRRVRPGQAIRAASPAAAAATTAAHRASRRSPTGCSATAATAASRTSP